LNKFDSLTIYSIYLRNHGEFNTFETLGKDLDRIRGMGFQAIWLLPIHPIGTRNKKGALGCPYAIADYGGINPEYGTLGDFRSFIHKAHEKGLKVIMDVVYNHTAYESKLYQEHPEFFLKDARGNPVTKEPEWEDVIDLDYSQQALWPLLIGYLKDWAAMGVDGFRCDVASLVPLDFWREAKKAVEAVKPGVLWLAESVHREFLEDLRARGFEGNEDAALYEVFDILYDYDIHPAFETFVKGETALKTYIEAIRNQDAIYPPGYVKLRFIENHDQPRFLAYGKTMKDKEKFTVLNYLLKGAVLFYAGQETDTQRTPSLFETDPIDLGHGVPSYILLVKKLNQLMAAGVFSGESIVYEVVQEKLLIVHDPEYRFLGAVNFGQTPLTHDFALGGDYCDVLGGRESGPLGNSTIVDYRIFIKK